MDAILTLVKYYLCSFILFTHLTSRNTEVIRITKLIELNGSAHPVSKHRIPSHSHVRLFLLYRVLK